MSQRYSHYIVLFSPKNNFSSCLGWLIPKNHASFENIVKEIFWWVFLDKAMVVVWWWFVSYWMHSCVRHCAQCFTCLFSVNHHPYVNIWGNWGTEIDVKSLVEMHIFSKWWRWDLNQAIWLLLQYPTDFGAVLKQRLG